MARRIRAKSRAVLARLARSQPGQDLVEYGMLLALLALVVLFGAMAFGSLLAPWLTQLAGLITTAGA
jgi:Flp pilus assembly pilin Flp